MSESFSLNGGDMYENSSFIEYLKYEQPGLWKSISSAADEGLIVIDEDRDAVTATNRLLLTYPELHTILNLLVENWIRNKAEELSRGAATLLLREAQDGNG